MKPHPHHTTATFSIALNLKLILDSNRRLTRAIRTTYVSH